MEKGYKTQVQSSEMTVDELELINRFARKSLTADEVYTFSVLLCDNEIDRDFERFETTALETLSKLFVGKTGIFDHSCSGHDQVARIYSAQLVTDETRRNCEGEPYAYIKAMAYMPRTDKNAGLIAEIDAGIKKEVSVSCSVEDTVCSVCGVQLMRGLCEHVKGKSYGGKLCHTVLGKPNDAYEWSFVAVPAQRAAGVTKSFRKKEVTNMQDIIKAIGEESGDITLTDAERKSLQGAIDVLKSQAADGVMYREAVTADALRAGLAAMPSIGAEKLRPILEKLSTPEIVELKKAFEQTAEKNIPLNVQLSGVSDEKHTNEVFKI